MAINDQLRVLNDDRCNALRCPSAQPDMEDARVLGVVQYESEDRQVAYVDEAVPVTAEILEMAEGVEPTEVMRFSARCDTSKCMHFDGTQCQLATRVVRMLPAVVDVLPACNIRADCRWYQQEGPPACERCPQVATVNKESDELLVAVALGSAAAGESEGPSTPDGLGS